MGVDAPWYGCLKGMVKLRLCIHSTISLLGSVCLCTQSDRHVERGEKTDPEDTNNGVDLTRRNNWGGAQSINLVIFSL